MLSLFVDIFVKLDDKVLHLIINDIANLHYYALGSHIEAKCRHRLSD